MATPQEKFQPIFQGRDFYVPAFDIKIKGIDLPKETARDVIAVRYNDSIDKIDTFEITVNNWDAEKLDFKYSGPKKGGDDKRSEFFMPGKTVELWMGYFKPIAAKNEDKDKPEPLRLMLVGKISKLAPTFPAAGQPTLKVSGQSILSELSAKQETKIYENKKASKIAEEVGERGNLKLDDMVVKVKPDPTAKDQELPLDYVLQDNQYDILFLLQLAHRYGYDVFLEDESKDKKPKFSVKFGPSTKEPPVSYSLEWGKSLIQFQPTLTTTNQVSEVTVRGWDALKKEAINVTVTRDGLDTRPLRDRKKLETLEKGFKEKKEIIVDKPFRNKKEAKEHAKALLKSITGKMVTARGSTVGTPDLRAGSRIEIKELGIIFNGTYIVTSSSHTIGSGGYITEFDARLEEKN